MLATLPTRGPPTHSKRATASREYHWNTSESHFSILVLRTNPDIGRSIQETRSPHSSLVAPARGPRRVVTYLEEAWENHLATRKRFQLPPKCSSVSTPHFPPTRAHQSCPASVLDRSTASKHAEESRWERQPCICMQTRVMFCFIARSFFVMPIGLDT